MTTGATPLLGLALPVQGELSGTWGDVVNNSITSLIDSAIAGTTTVSSVASTVTLTTGDFAANQARQAVILCTSTSNIAQNIYVPDKSKVYVVINKSQRVVTVSSIYDTGVSVPIDATVVIAWNGSAFVPVSGYTGYPLNTQTGSSYTATYGDSGKLIVLNGPTSVSLPAYTANTGTKLTFFNYAGSSAVVTGNFYKSGNSAVVTTLTIAKYGSLTIVSSYDGSVNGWLVISSVGVT